MENPNEIEKALEVGAKKAKKVAQSVLQKLERNGILNPFN